MNSFLFDVTKGQSNSTMTFCFSEKFCNYNKGVFELDFNLLKDEGFDGHIYFNNVLNSMTEIIFTRGMRVCVDVNKRYAWDKKEVICNQPVNYYCSKGWVGSIIAFIKDKFQINEAAL